MWLSAADTFGHFLTQYGYIAVFLAAMIEGESVVLAASIFASQGKLDIQHVAVAAFLGTLISEQILYLVGRSFGKKILIKFPKLQEKVQKIIDMLERHTTFFIFSSRFIYGIRSLSPVVIGMTNIPPRRFMILNLLAAIVWTILSCAAGYFLGEIIFTYLGKMHGAFKILAICLLSLLLIGYAHKLSRKFSSIK